eukprot:s1233_g10.t1
MRRSSRGAFDARPRGKRRRLEREAPSVAPVATPQAAPQPANLPRPAQLPRPEVCADDALAVFSAALSNALEKLLGRPPTPEDRIFHFDPERQRASLELPSLRPPQQLSCATEMDEDVEFSDLTKSEQVTLKQSELESEGLLTFDASQPPLHAWVPGKDQRRIALIPRVLRHAKTVPPRVTKASSAGVKTGEPVFMRLRKLQDSFASNPPEEYKEQIIFRQSAEEPWYATVVLKGSATQGERLEGAALGQSAQAAREAAVQVLLDRMPRSTVLAPAPAAARSRWRQALAQPYDQRHMHENQRATSSRTSGVFKKARFARPWTRTWTRPWTATAGMVRRQGTPIGQAPPAARLTEAPREAYRSASASHSARTPPPPPKPKRMQPRMVS